MPIPVHADIYQAQVIFPALNGIPEDVFTNTFYFTDAATVKRSHAAVADLLETRMEGFYNVAQGGASQAVRFYMSRVINWPGVLLKVFDLGDTPPRTPEERVLELTQPTDTGALPNEVACVLSYRGGSGTTGGGSADPRKRGRAFIGPLNPGAGSFTLGTDSDLRVNSGFIDSLTKAADWMRDVLTDELGWLQYSRANDGFLAVTGGFVDNRFDTQRRRGLAASTRTTW